MTTNTLAAIRERADTLEALNWREEDFDAYRYLPQTHDDLAALLAIVDALTARAEAAEAALRDTSALLEKHCELEPNWNGQEYDLPFAVRLRLGENSDLLAAHAANGESAGNGGA